MSEISKFTTAREQMKTALEAFAPDKDHPDYKPFASLVFMERAGNDIDNEVEEALNKNGLAIIILSVSAGIIDQIRQGAVSLRATVPVCVLENVARNMAEADEAAELPAGTKLPSELVVQYVIRGLLGKEIGDGCATLAKDAFARGGDDAGLVENYIGIDVPIMLRGG